MIVEKEAKLKQIQAFSDTEKWAEFNDVLFDDNDNGAVFHLTIKHSIMYFQGHFPEQPILPGVVQTHWACELAQLVFDINTDFSGLENIKFQSVIQPDQKVTLTLHFKQEKNLVVFKYADDNQKFSEGRLRFSN